MTEANEMAKKIKEAHSHNQREYHEVETEASGMNQKKVQNQIEMRIYDFQSQPYGFSFTVPTELEAYKAAYKLNSIAHQVTVKYARNSSLKKDWSNEWAIEACSTGI